MGNYENLKQSITEVIRTNGNQEITGAVLQSTLLTIISTVGANATFAGIATPTTNPGTPDGSVFYLASESGTYSNFGGIELQDGLSVLMWNGSWNSQQIFGVDDVPTIESDNLVKSGGVYAKIKALEDAGYIFVGIATPTTNPGTPNKKVFYLASESGTYTNFNATELQDGLSVLTWNGSWNGQQIFSIDDVPTAGSDNLVKSGGVAESVNKLLVDLGTMSYFEIIGNSSQWQQSIEMYSGDIINQTKLYVKCTKIQCSTTPQETLYPYLRFFDSQGSMILNSQIRDYVRINSFDIPNNAASYKLMFFSSIGQYPVEGATYSITCGIWFDNSTRTIINEMAEDISTIDDRVDVLEEEIEHKTATIPLLINTTNQYQKNLQKAFIDLRVEVFYNDGATEQENKELWTRDDLVIKRISPKVSYTGQFNLMIAQCNSKKKITVYIGNQNYGYVANARVGEILKVSKIEGNTYLCNCQNLTEYTVDGRPISIIIHAVVNFDYVESYDGVFANNMFNRDLMKDEHEGVIMNIQIPLKNDELISQLDSRVDAIEDKQLEGLNLGVDGDSITAGNQWSYYAAQELKFATHHNVAVGSATFEDREANSSEGMKYTQNYNDPDFAGISGGWQPTDDPIEIQKRCNNCARVHVQKFISEVTAGLYPIPDIFVFAMSTNDKIIGTIEDALNGKDANNLTAEVRRTMAGGARWAIQKIVETYPNCRVYVSAPIQRADETANEKGLQKTDILRGICNGLSVGFFNTFGECGITEKLETGTGRYLRDGLHPNTEGQKLMGRYLAKEIRNNYF